MLVTVTAIALIYGIVKCLQQMMRADGAKILAALQGKSLVAGPPRPGRIMIVRLESDLAAHRLCQTSPALRAAA